MWIDCFASPEIRVISGIIIANKMQFVRQKLPSDDHIEAKIALLISYICTRT